MRARNIIPVDKGRERETHTQATEIANMAMALRNKIDKLPMRLDDMINWQMHLTQIQSAYLGLAKAAGRNLEGE